ncbi:hypothetical protein IMCC14465_16620 [alpha proteobacterium IMCC14465]|uniref:Uncharacterized protein n=1 Tax=alpha proteobacterium IMCC14465 TaxID=1220535 RepID=J9DU82_9PROT|nr:hypothetical protein IMCC14465_16620 [alpha proteobacterium IMCC14465]
MSSKSHDPFGGIKGDKVIADQAAKKLSPMEVDKQQALKDIQASIDLWDGKMPPEIERATLLERFREKTKLLGKEPPNWSYIKLNDKSFADVHFRWSGKKIDTICKIPKREVRVALVGLQSFYKMIDPFNPDLSHPDVIKCFNLTAEHYNLDPFIPGSDLSYNRDKHIDPFAGVRGENPGLKHNVFKKDLQNAKEELTFSIEYLEQLDVPSYRKEYSVRKTSPKNLQQTYKTSTSHFDVFLWWPGGVVDKIENVPQKRALMALGAMRKFLEDIDEDHPDLENETVKNLYEITKKRTRPKKGKQNLKELLPEDEGGLSYWSNLTHRWIKGSFDKKTSTFNPPAKGK